MFAWLGGGGTFIQSKASNEVDAGRNWAAPASVRHDDDEPLTPISSCYCMTVLEPLGLVAEISVKVTAETAGLLSGKSAVPAVEEQSIRIP